MKIDPITGVLIYADDDENMIGSKFEATAEAIQTEVEDRKEANKGFKTKIEQLSNKISLIVEDKSGKIKGASIVLAINEQSSVTISADKIALDGKTIAKLIQSTEITVNSLTVTNGFDAKDIDCSHIDCSGISTNAGNVICGGITDTDRLKVDGSEATWKSAKVYNFTFSLEHSFVYMKNGNEYTTSGYIIGSKTEKTIYYLGKDG